MYMYIYMYRVDIHTSRITTVDSPTYRWDNSRRKVTNPITRVINQLRFVG